MERYWNPVETAPIHEMKALQSLRLSQTVRHVYEHVPFYRKKFDEMGLKPENIQSIDDISKLPFTYKQDLRDNYPYGLFAVPVEDLVRIQAARPVNRRWWAIHKMISRFGATAADAL